MTDIGRMALQPLLEVRDLTIVFDTQRGPLTAVDGVSFSLAAGEILGVVGESGAGKSLTGTAITGLLERPGRIAGGEIRFEGQRIDNLPRERMRRIRGKKIGAVFPGSADQPQPAVHRRRPVGRDHRDPPRPERRGGTQARDRAAGGSGHPGA